MSVANAWVLSISENLYVAIGELEMVHIHSEIPVLVPISKKSDYCQYQILWQEQHLSLLDLGLLLYGEPLSDKNTKKTNNMFLCVVSYMSQRENIQEYGAILSSHLPVRIKVDDKQVCELPDSPETWSMLAISCFSHEVYGTVPILDLPRIFSAQANDVMAEQESDPFD
jgi:hypothetical protein